MRISFSVAISFQIIFFYYHPYPILKLRQIYITFFVLNHTKLEIHHIFLLKIIVYYNKVLLSICELILIFINISILLENCIIGLLLLGGERKYIQHEIISPISNKLHLTFDFLWRAYEKVSYYFRLSLSSAMLSLNILPAGND
jgi:hypothetical protein